MDTTTHETPEDTPHSIEQTQQPTGETGGAGMFESPEHVNEAETRLLLLRADIAALRIKSEAETNAAAVNQELAPADTDCSMVAVFNAAIQNREVMSGDRDVAKRDERIWATLKLRGALRIQGAVASPSLADAIASLHQTHPNFSEATDHILGEEILARQRGGAINGIRLLLYGEPGVGKTNYAMTLAKLLGVPGEVLGLSSAQAAAHLAGSEQYWSNSQPGAVFQALVQGTYANPCFILDEADKVSDSSGDPLGALYQLLEPLSAAVFCDKSVPWLPIDASRVNWIATANDIDKLNPALRSRFVEVEVGMPSEIAQQTLIQRLYQDLLAECQLTKRFPPRLHLAQVVALQRSSIREVKRALRSALAMSLRLEATELAIPTSPVQAVCRNRIGFI